MRREMLANAAQLVQGPDPQAAAPVVDQLLAHAPDDPDILTLAAILAQRTGRSQDAIRFFRAACNADRHNAARHQNLAVALKAAQAYEEALAAFSAALALRPNHAPTLSNLGSCLIACGRPQEALAVLREALAIAPDSAELLNNHGIALARLGQQAEACISYQRALAARPDYTEAQLNYADALAAMGDIGQATTLASRVLHIMPDNIRAANQLGLLLERAGDHHAAADILLRAYKKGQPNHALGINLARALLRSGQADRALDICENLIASQPSITTPLALAVVALQRLGRVEAQEALMGVARFVSIHDFEEVDGFASLEAFNAALVAELRNHPSLTFEPLGLVTRQGRQSDDLAQETGPAMQALATMARQKLAAAVASFSQHAPDHPFLQAVPREWDLTMWGTILSPGGEVGPHIHAPNWLSGVYYPEFSAGARDDREGAFAIGLLPEELREAERSVDGEMIVFQPRSGRMILFPSYLWHATLPFSGNSERISFAFDLVPKGVGNRHKLA